MRKSKLTVAAVLLCGAMLTNSCVGYFAMFNKLASWNNRATNSKFLNEILFLVLSPAHVFCLTADALVLNTIEFWSGSNPMAQNVGKSVNVMGQDGRYYAVKTLKNGYEVKAPTGEVYAFIYDKTNDSWSQMQDGKVVEIFRFNNDGTIKLNLNGQTMDVALDESGVYQVANATGQSMLWASR